MEQFDHSITDQRRTLELDTLWRISQAIVVETDIEQLFRVVHDQVRKALGNFSSFAVAMYDHQNELIRIPYLIEGDQPMEFSPFPLGEGLTSIVIRSGEPLLLVQDVEFRAAELGAKIKGVPSKSWLGVPIKIRNEVLGVIIVQDSEHENRFNDADQRFITTIASQVAIAIRNSKLLESATKRENRAILLNEITNKIRRSSNIQLILRTTAEELGKAMNAHRVRIKIDMTQAVRDD